MMNNDSEFGGDGSSAETDGPNLGQDGTIPNSDDGIAVGHNPNGSHFNPEEDAPAHSDLVDPEDGTDPDGTPTENPAG